MRQLSIILFGILILTGCTDNKQNGSKKTIYFEPFTSNYIKELGRDQQLQSGGSKLSWKYRCEDICLLENLPQATLEILRKNHEIADSIITDNDIYDLLGQTIFPATSKSLPGSGKVLIQQVTFANIDMDFKTLSEYYREFINKSDVLFLFSQMTNKPYYWNEKKMHNVKCISTKELEEIYYIPDNIHKDSIRTLLSRSREKMKAKYGHDFCEVYSKPIFNRNKTFAIMTLHSGYYGNIMFFRKINNKWKLIKRLGTWIS